MERDKQESGPNDDEPSSHFSIGKTRPPLRFVTLAQGAGIAYGKRAERQRLHQLYINYSVHVLFDGRFVQNIVRTRFGLQLFKYEIF